MEQEIKTQHKLADKVFIRKAKLKHGDRYNYDLVNYTKSKNKVKIICQKHGEFEQTASSHLNGAGCPICGARRFGLSDFMEKANKIHNNKYDYSHSIYDKTTTKVKIICNVLDIDGVEHGKFFQTPQVHLKGGGCPKCYSEKNKVVKLKTTEQYVIDAKKIHGDKYDYSKSVYTSAIEKINIICPTHGEFFQRACNHLLGAGCPKCGNLKTLEQYIIQARKIHGDKYDYSESEYTHSEDKIKIICKSHGEFFQQANSHLRGYGCPECAKEIIRSKNEILINSFLVDELGIETITSYRKLDVLFNHELDIYIPSKKLAIEYNGLYWHNEVNTPDKNYHLKKTEACESQDIQLIHIFEDEWIEKPDIIKSRLINLLGLNKERIFARKCIIKEVNNTDTKLFLETNHIQGFVGSKISYGLYYNNVLVSLMTFGSRRKNLGSKINNDTEYELLRFCNKLNCSVIGGASKLFKHFLKLHNPSKVISYADRRWSLGKLYEQLGFEFSHNSVPNYFYVMGQKRKNRFNFRKDILISKYGCSPDDTEHNFCFNKKWYRIYDCGAKVYVWNIKHFDDDNY